jgi:hypothetical protein
VGHGRRHHRSAAGDETYLLVGNPGDTTAKVTFSLQGMTDESFVACDKTVAVVAHSRYTAGTKDICPGFASIDATTMFGTVTSDGPGIVVERSTYWSTPDQFWAADASTLLTKIR